MEKGQNGGGEPHQSIKTASGPSRGYLRSVDFKTMSDSEDDSLPPLDRCLEDQIQVKDAEGADLTNLIPEIKNNSSTNDNSIPDLEKSHIASSKSAWTAMIGRLSDTIRKNVQKAKADQEQKDILCPTLADEVRTRLCFGKLMPANLKLFDAKRTESVINEDESTESLKNDESEEKDTCSKLKYKIQVKITSPQRPDNMKVSDEMCKKLIDEEDADATGTKEPKSISHFGAIVDEGSTDLHSASAMSNDLEKQTANTAEKRRILSGECDKKIEITKLQSFKDYKLSRSQLRKLTDLLEVPEEDNELEDNNNSFGKGSHKMKSNGSVESKNGGFLKTSMGGDEVKCCSGVSKEVKVENKVYSPVNSTEEIECVLNSEDESSSIIDVVGGGENDDEETVMSVWTESADRGVKRPAVVEETRSNEERNGDDKKLHFEDETNDIASQVFKCMLCGEKSVYIPLDEILIHRWQHYKEMMTYNQYIKGLTEYPSGFKKPPTISKRRGTSTSQPSLASPEDSSNGTGYSPELALIVDSPPSYEVEVIVTTDQ